MGKCHKFDYLRTTIGALLFVSIQGCAFFSGKADPPTIPADLAGTTQTLPLPVEIAKDISILASGGSIEPINPALPGSRQPAKAAEPEAEEDRQVDHSDCDCDNKLHSAKANKKSPPSKTAARAATKPPKSKSARSGPVSNEDYTVKPDDTLMKISFEKFGNVYRWREIYNENKDRIPDYNQLVEGTILKIKGVEYVVIERNGLPYLIRRNDTLVKISRGVYGTPKRWKHLWENNRQLIRDPNKIYAGFTLYYQPDGAKPVASKIDLKGPLRSRKPAAKK